MTKGYSLNILRVGMAITFLWIGVLILKDPEAWTPLVQPWAEKILGLFGTSLDQALFETAILNMLVGFFLLIDRFTLVAASLGFTHILIVLITTGITVITVRDIGLLAAALALVFASYPEGFKPKTLKDYLSLLAK